MKELFDFISSEAVLTAIIGIVSAIWSLIRGSEWWREQKDRENAVLYELVEQAAESTFHSHVKQWKNEDRPEDGSPKGSLSDDEKAKARAIAVNLIYEYGSKKGLDIGKLVGKDQLDAIISLVISKAKAERKK